MPVFTKIFNLVWELDYAPNYQFDKKGNCFNIKTGRQIKQTMIGYTIGYCIQGKFKSTKQLRKHLVKIKNIKTPF
jgi:hypothetical protein